MKEKRYTPEQATTIVLVSRESAKHIRDIGMPKDITKLMDVFRSFSVTNQERAEGAKGYTSGEIAAMLINSESDDPLKRKSAFPEDIKTIARFYLKTKKGRQRYFDKRERLIYNNLSEKFGKED